MSHRYKQRESQIRLAQRLISIGRVLVAILGERRREFI